MVLRIKAKWHESKRTRSKGSKTLVERAGVVGVNLWKIAFATYKEMEKGGFPFGTDGQVISVLSELIAFLIQVVDRSVYGKLDESERRAFINALAKHLANTIQSNMRDISGDGNYIPPFIDMLNKRLKDYAEFEYGHDGPGYAFTRYLGERISEAMAATDNKWVIEHVMEIEAPAALELVKKVVDEVLGAKVTQART